MRSKLPFIVAVGAFALLGCPKGDSASTDPESAGGNMLGLDVSPGREGESSVSEEDKVPVKCMTDPGDPECEGPLGYTRGDAEELEFGDVCRRRVCHGRGDCELDADGNVACVCDDDAGGLTCEKKRRR